MRASPRGLRPAVFALGLVVAASCGSPSGPAPVASVVISPAGPSIITGTSQQLSAATNDAKGNALTNRAVTWSSTSTSVATVSTSGMVTGVTPGTTVINAASEGISGSTTVTVLPVPVASVRVTPAAASVTAGNTTQLSADALDGAGNVLTGRSILWTSGTPGTATVSVSGLVTGVAAGSVTISAASEGKVGTATVTVLPPPPAPIVESVTPSPLVPGSTATITGQGFGGGGSATVTIGGAPAPLVGGGAGQLVVLVPCVRSGTAAVRVTVNNASGERNATVATTSRSLAVGQHFITSDAPSSACNELVATAGPARYLVTVFSNATSANSLVDFQLDGNPAAAGSASVRATPAAPARITAPVRDAAYIQDSAHFAFLERDRALYEQLRGTFPRASLTASQTATPLPTVGQMRSAFFTYTGGCNDTTRVIRAKAIYVGSKAIIWEDSTNTLQSADNSELAGYYQRLGTIFDQEQYDAVRTTFSDPLRRDAVTDNDGRVHMIFTQRLVSTGAAAYVTSCDQFPVSSSTRGSNFGEYFYGFVPTLTGSNLNTSSYADGWFYFMARTVVHEVKHVASHGARVANNAPAYEQSWLEEGTARHAEEVWVRGSLHRVAWKGNTGWGTAASGGVYCDHHPSDATCNAGDALRRPSYGMRRQFNENREKLLEPWNWSPFGTGSDQSGSGFYQVSWMLVRYALDRFGASDAAFFTTLTNSLTNGVTNLTTTSGATIDRLLGGWGLAIYADDYPGLTSPDLDLQFPTWNLRSIYAGLNAAPAWTTRWSTPYPVQPTALGFGSFTSVRTGLRGGAHAYFEISGTTSGSQLISIRSPGGGDASTSIRVAIVRLP